jgi:hypothetical protein
VQELGLSPDAGYALGDCTGGAPHDASDLAVGGAVDDAFGDRDGQFRTLEVVAEGKRLLRERVLSNDAVKPGDDSAVALPLVALVL